MLEYPFKGPKSLETSGVGNVAEQEQRKSERCPHEEKDSGTIFESNHIPLVNNENKATNIDHRLKYKGLQNNIKATSFYKRISSTSEGQNPSHSFFLIIVSS